MKSTSFKETNMMLGAGDNPNTNDLPVCHAIDPHTNMPFIISKFKLDEEEMKRINETGEIWIGIMGDRMHPILPTVYNPFTEHGFLPKKLQ